MARFAVGKNSYAISDRSGLRYRYKDMRREWNGLLVGKDEYEPKHPQLEPYSRVSDAIGLKDARPDRDENKNATITFPIFSLSEVQFLNSPMNTGRLGQVTVEATENVSLTLTGEEITSSLGSVVVVTT